MIASTNDFERALQVAWTSSHSTPFPGQIAPSDPIAAQAAARTVVAGSLAGARRLFREAPCLGVWATLAPLADYYGAEGAEVYHHISDGLGVHLNDPANRSIFKSVYKAAAARMGIALAGNNPTQIFFAPLGVADAQIQPLANALIAAMAHLGIPSTEDTPSAVAWQRRALTWCPDSLARVRAAVRFDQVGHYAARANRWRSGDPPETLRDEILFAALERAATAQKVRRDRIVGPPVLVWARDGMALLAEPAKIAQSVALGAFPTRLKGGVPHALRTPWPDDVAWTAGRTQRVQCAPADGEVLLFDADTGMIETRAKISDSNVAMTGRQAIAVAARAFNAETFGSAEPAKDSRFRFAWVQLEQSAALDFETGERIVLSRSAEPSLRIDSRLIGRAGSRPLYGGHGTLDIQLNPALLSPRILRVTTERGARQTVVTPGADGQAQIDFATLGFDHPGDPVRAIFEILALGASEPVDARAELRAAAFVWPGVQPEETDEVSDAPKPSTFNAARSAGFEAARNRVWMNPEADIDAALLAVEIDGDLFEFTCPFRGVRLWRHRIATGARERVAHGAHLILGHADRNDTLTFQAPGCRADLRILGHLKRRPCAARSEYAIGAEMLEPGDDDRIILEHPDGTSELLARILRENDPAELAAEDTNSLVRLTFRPQQPIDAVGVWIDTADGDVLEGAEALGHRAIDARLPQGVEARAWDDGRVEVTAAWEDLAAPARLGIRIRSTGSEDFDTLRGADGYLVALGLRGRELEPTAQNLSALSRLLAEPVTAALEGQLSQALGPAHRRILAEMGRAKMASRILPALAVEHPSGGLPRGDILSAAPWLFEAPLTAFGPLASHTELAALGRMSSVPAPGGLPDPRGEDPLGAWLDRIASADCLPRELAAGELDAAFVALRTRLGRPDLEDIRGGGALGGAVRLLASVDVPHLDRLRTYDRTMGYDAFGARLVALIERFARASRLKLAGAAFDEIVRRTGLAPTDAGEALTLVCRVGVEALANFLTLWDHAAREHEQQTQIG